MLLGETATARAEAPATATTATDTYVTFGLGVQTFGVEVAHVREILDRQMVCRLPNAAPDCEGVIDARGESVPLIELARRLGVPRGEPGPDTRIIVFEIAEDGPGRPVGVLADRVLNVIRIPPGEIEPTPAAALDGASDRGLRGIARLEGQLVVLLDIAHLFGGRSAEAL